MTFQVPQEIEDIVLILTIRRADAHENRLLEIYESFGGFDGFTQPKMEEEMLNLRGALLSADHFPVELHNKIIAGISKFKRHEIGLYGIGRHPSIFKNYPLFKRLWDINPDGMAGNLHNFSETSVKESKEWNSAEIWKNLPTIHTEECKSGSINSHKWCTTDRVFQPDIALDVAATMHNKLINHLVDPQIINLLHENILNLSTYHRAEYASGHLVKDDHWTKLAEDSKRDVLNRLVNNSLLPTDVARSIIATHKSPMLRESIAHLTADRTLLEEIWNSTKSGSIHAWVKDNPFWSNPS